MIFTHVFTIDPKSVITQCVCWSVKYCIGNVKHKEICMHITSLQQTNTACLDRGWRNVV